MHKNFQLHRHHLGNGTYLLTRQFPGQHDTRKPRIVKETHFFHRTIIGLRTGMKGNRRYIETQDTHILHNKRIDTHPIKFGDKPLGWFQVIVIKQRIQSNIYTSLVSMCEIDQSGNIVHTVCRRRSRTETRTADIHGIGPMQNIFDTYIGRLGGSQQFDRAGYIHRISSIL